MAYSNYGAYVYCNNNNRREDKEDVTLFENIKANSFADYCHGILGDGNIRVRCYKQYAPEIFERKDDGSIVEINYYDEYDDEIDCFEFSYKFNYKNYSFSFESGKQVCTAIMVEPDGTKWECTYGYEYGSG